MRVCSRVCELLLVRVRVYCVCRCLSEFFCPVFNCASVFLFSPVFFWQPLCHSAAEAGGVWLLLKGSVVSFSPKDISLSIAPGLRFEEMKLEDVVYRSKKGTITEIRNEELAEVLKQRSVLTEKEMISLSINEDCELTKQGRYYIKVGGMGLTDKYYTPGPLHSDDSAAQNLVPSAFYNCKGV